MKKILTILSFLASLQAFSQITYPKSVDEYAQLLKEVREQSFFNKNLHLFFSKLTSNKENSKIEHVYHKGIEAIHDLSDQLGNNENEIDAKWLKAMRTKLEGFDLNPNTETYVANPNLEFFKNLSKKYGSKADIAFFEISSQMNPSNTYFPVYIQQETDLSGCTLYNGSLTKFHQEWSKYKKSYAQSYVKEVKANIDDIEKNLYASTCFCNKSKDPILSELGNFLKMNPKAAVSAKIKKRISEINANKVVLSGCNY